jgi:hypothetical protein
MIISVFYGVLYDTTLAFRGLTAAIYLIHATSYYGCSIKSPTLSYHKTYHKIALKTIDLYTCIILPHNIIHHRASQESMALFPQPSPNATYPECPHQSPSKSGGRHSLPNLEPLRLNSAALRPNPPKNKTPAPSPHSPHSVEAEPDHACTSRGLGQRVPPQPHASPRGQSPGGRLGTRMRPSVLAPRPAAMACLLVEGDALGLGLPRTVSSTGRRVPRGRSATDKTRGELVAKGKDGPGSAMALMPMLLSYRSGG